jgi:cardiolipin hydrolase
MTENHSEGATVRVAFDRDCIGELERTLRAAADRVDVCVFAIADDRLKDLLLALHRRGVIVRILTEGDTASNDGADAIELQRAGIEVRFETTPALMHHKFLVVDERVTVTGSLNWTRKATELNYENLVVIDDPGVAAAFAMEFDRLWRMRGTSARVPPRGQDARIPVRRQPLLRR